MNRKEILNILFWILLVVGIGLVLWKIFGNSPSDLSIMLTFTLMLLFKMWGVSDELKDFKSDVKISFSNVKNEISKLKNKK